jgi:hypothetical protein
MGAQKIEEHCSALDCASCQVLREEEMDSRDLREFGGGGLGLGRSNNASAGDGGKAGQGADDSLGGGSGMAYGW